MPTELKQMLLDAPYGHLDASIKPMIEKWDEPPTALQILEVLDKCIYAALASGFVIDILETMLAGTNMEENTTYELVEALAVWRKQYD